jgi:hypothetical protein
MVALGYIGISVTIVMAAAVFPILKAERRGVENRWGNEAHFEALHKLLIAGIVLLLAPIHRPWVGLVLHI